MDFVQYEAFEDNTDSDSLQEWEDEGGSISKVEKHSMVRKKIEERLEQKKLRHELDDYDEEVFKEFEWDKDK
jgi:hypothetical protein